MFFMLIFLTYSVFSSVKMPTYSVFFKHKNAHLFQKEDNLLDEFLFYSPPLSAYFHPQPMGKPEVGCHKNDAAQCQEQELYGACGEPYAPHAIRGIGQKEEGGHYAWDISPKKYRLSEMD